MGKPFAMGNLLHPVPACVATAGNAAVAGDRVSLENYERLGILVVQKQAAADSGDILVHIATAASGGTEDTSVTINHWWSCVDVTEGTTADTWTKGTAAATIATSATGSGTSYYWLEIGADELPDSTAEYKFVEFNATGNGSASNTLQAFYFLINPRYPQGTSISAQA